MKRAFVAVLAIIGFVISGPAAMGQESARDSLSADGPYILYRADGVEVITVDVDGNITRQSFDSLPAGYTFRVTDHRGEYPFEVSLRPFGRGPWELSDTPRRTFVMSDPHGKLDCIISLLAGNGLIDEDLHWSYGTDRLVVIGDVADRGNDVIAICWFFYRLQQEAADAGGSVIMMLGNHEPMDFGGDLRYTKPKYPILARLLGVEYRDLFGPQSELGRWIMSWNTVCLIGGDLYVHAGVGGAFYRWNLPFELINTRMSEVLPMRNRDRKALSDTLDFLYGSYGPIWYRGLVFGEARRHPITQDTLELLLQRYDVGHIIVGHTVLEGVTAFHGGRVIGVNVDNSHNRRHRLTRALLIEEGRYYAVNDEGEKTLLITE